MKYWFDVEADIRALRSEPNGYALDDVCFKPAGPDGYCVVQSVAAWFGNDLEMYDEDTWASHLVDCANSPVECLPDFQQPLSPLHTTEMDSITNDSTTEPSPTKSQRSNKHTSTAIRTLSMSCKNYKP